MTSETQTRMPFESDESLSAALEALLFIYGERMELAELAKILGESQDRIRSVAHALAEKLSGEKRGIRVIADGTSLQLATAPELSEIVQRVIKHEFSEELSPASIETLAIIAYRGPISRSEIDYIRGVNSTFMLRSLLIRGLVQRKENPARPNSFVYTVSMDALQYLGLEKPEDLPEFATYHTLSFEQTNSEKPGPETPADAFGAPVAQQPPEERVADSSEGAQAPDVADTPEIPEESH
jgi:segregation and condensation protein B